MTTQEIKVEMLTFECIVCHTQMQVRAHLITAGPWCHLSPMLVVRS